jgi:hypothetical protein
MDKIGSVVLDFVKSEELTPFAFTLLRREAGYYISTDVTHSQNQDSFLVYIDPSS